MVVNAGKGKKDTAAGDVLPGRGETVVGDDRKVRGGEGQKTQAQGMRDSVQ